eukprot:gene7307-14900_t
MNEADARQMTPEDQSQMMDFLSELNNLRENDPLAFRNALSAMENELGLAPSSSSIETLTKDIQNMNHSSSTSSIPVDLPGGKAMLGSKGVEEKMKGIKITPTPAFTLKTKEISKSVKVFINICTHENIAMPGIKKKLDEEGKEIEGMNIPMSVGPAKMGKDKSNIDCIIYDIIINPKVIQDVNEDKIGTYRDFVCQLAMQSLEQKYELSIDKRYKLPKLLYLGEITSQYIQDRSNTPIIEEVNSTNKSLEMIRATQEKQKILANAKKSAEFVNEIDLIYHLFWVQNVISNDLKTEQNETEIQSVTKDIPFEDVLITNSYIEPMYPIEDHSRGLALVTAIIPNIPLLVSDIDAKISPYKIELKLPGYRRLNLFLPCSVLPTTASCTLSRPPGTLRGFTLRIFVELDHRPCDAGGVGPDPGSMPWQVAQALRGDGDAPYVLDEDDNDDGDIDGGDSGNGDVLKKKMKKKNKNENKKVYSDESLFEDEFHVKAFKNTQKDNDYKNSNGNSNNNKEDDDDDVLPEDRFHKKDAGSNYIIQQREREINEKRDKHAKDKEERKNDPNIEYIDADDYRSGGKHGPKLAEADHTTNNTNSFLTSTSSTSASASNEKIDKNREMFRVAANVLGSSADLK